MKKYLMFLLFTPLFANAQVINDGFSFGALLGVLLGIGIFILIFLALRQLVLWYWKIETIISYQEQNIKALQAIYNNNEELLRVVKQQTEILKNISENH